MDLEPYEVLADLAGGGALVRVRTPDGREVFLERGRGRHLRLLACLGERDGFVPVSATGRSADGSYAILAPPPGCSLEERLRRGPLAASEAVELARGLAHALTRAHRLGATHGDLRPAAVHLGPGGHPLVLGLGLGPGDEFDETADVRALATLVFEAACGHKPAPGDSLASRRSDLPRDLARAVDRALAPGAGPALDAAAFARAIEEPPRRMERGFALAAAVVLLASVGALVVLRDQGAAAAPPTRWPELAPAASSTHVLLARFELPDGTPPVIAHLTAAGGRVAVGGGYGALQTPSTVLDVASGRVARLDVAGAIIDPVTRLYVGAARDDGAPAGAETTPLARAFDSTTHAPAWSARIGLYGGFFDVDAATGLVYVTCQGGPLDDPLYVLDGKTGRVVAGPRKTGGVVASVRLDPLAHRAWVVIGTRTVVFGPPPALELVQEWPDMQVVALDPGRGRVYFTAWMVREPRGEVARLVVAERGLPPRRTALTVPGALAHDPVADRLYVARSSPGVIDVIDAETLQPIERITLEAGATHAALAVDPVERRLYAAIASGERRTLHVVALPR